MSKHVIVIGAGIVGASIAYNLSKAGCEVTILEQHSAASGATGKSFGWINANFPESQEFFRLRTESMHEHHALEHELGGDCGLVWGGSLWWEVQGREFNSHVSELSDLGYSVQVMTRSQVLELEPALSGIPEKIARFTDEGAADPIKLTHHLLTSCQRQGVKLLKGSKAQSLLFRASRCIGVRTDFGDFHADHTVVAMGTGAAKFLASASINLPMRDRKGMIVHTLPVEPVINHIMLSPEIHFRQQSNGSIVLGEDFGGGNINQAPDRLARELLDRLSKYLPGLAAPGIAEITMAMRPEPGDGFPVVGAPRGSKGLYIASMHSGVTLAPVVGKLAAREITSQGRETLLDPFRLERFQQT
jgi:glycine/D-amino acid oxidase-like deaminating enzyme